MPKYQDSPYGDVHPLDSNDHMYLHPRRSWTDKLGDGIIAFHSSIAEAIWYFLRSRK